jgi:type II secretory pathway predicted ATPase ExeA
MQMHESVLAFFGFSRLPFGKHLQSKDLYAAAAHQEAVARLSFGVAEEDILLLCGPVGCGKSVVLAAFVSELDTNRYSPLYLRGAGLSESQLYKSILQELKIEPPFFAGQAKRLFFKTIPELAKKPVAIIDDAQDLPDTALLAIKSMVNFSFDSSTPITFVLAGEPQLTELLKYAQFLSLRQRIRISYHMQPMSLEETCAYIDHHTTICGCPTPIFADDAKADVHRHTGGIARLINAICYRSILSAAANNVRIIDSTNLASDDLDE